MDSTPQQRFEGLFRANYAAVRGYALRRISPEVAQDVVAETFMIAWKRIDDVPDDALPWLFGVARRVLANQRRAASRATELARRAAAESATAVPDPQDAVGEAEAVRLALAGLPERDREAIMLVAWHGLSGARAARAAGCSRTAFGVRLHRARRRLAARLGAPEANPVAGNAESVEAS